MVINMVSSIWSKRSGESWVLDCNSVFKKVLLEEQTKDLHVKMNVVSDFWLIYYKLPSRQSINGAYHIIWSESTDKKPIEDHPEPTRYNGI